MINERDVPLEKIGRRGVGVEVTTSIPGFSTCRSEASCCRVRFDSKRRQTLRPPFRVTVAR